MPNLTVFDLDHTLLRVNSSFHFGAYLYQKKYISTFSMIDFVRRYLCHKLLGTPMVDLHLQIFKKLFLGRSITTTSQQVEVFLDQQLQSILYHPVLIRLNESLSRGDHTLILSSAPHFLVESIAKRLNVLHWDATHYEVDESGLFSMITKYMEGEQKAIYVSQLAKKLAISKSQITAYTDSYLDLPLLMVAGKPVAVQPDKKLRKVSQSQGWEII